MKKAVTKMRFVFANQRNLPQLLPDEPRSTVVRRVRNIVALLCLLLLSGNCAPPGPVHNSTNAWNNECRDMELALLSDPSLNYKRCNLIRHYYQQSITTDSEIRNGCTSAQIRHVLWLIQNAPAETILGEDAASRFDWLTPDERASLSIAWRKAVDAHPNNLLVLEHAIKCEIFSVDGDFKDYAQLWRLRADRIRRETQTIK